MARLYVLCLCAVQIVNCQFNLFEPDPQAFNFAKNLGNFRGVINGFSRRNRPAQDRPFRPYQDFGQQRPVSFPTEEPNYGQQQNQYGQQQNQYGQQQNPNFGQQQNQYGQQQNPNFGQPQFSDGQVNFVNEGSNSQTTEGQVDGNVNGGLVFQPAYQPDEDSKQNHDYLAAQGNVNVANNDGSSSGSYNGPNDAVNFGNQETTEAASTPSADSRNNFNFEPVLAFHPLMTYKGVVRGTSVLRHMPTFCRSETCRTIDDTTGSCINIYSCPRFLKVLQDSQRNPDAVNILRRAHCGFEGNNPRVCCPLPGIPTAAPPKPTTTTPAPTQAPTQAPTAGPKAAGDFLASLPTPPVCGVSNTTLSRVVGGVPAKLGAFPWMALLGYKRAEDTRWLCGGSLVTSRHILTAAHCIHNHERDLYVVRLGELDLAREDEGATPMDVLIKRQIKHEQYSPKAFSNDIALLELERDVEFTKLIKPICLPTAQELRSSTFEDYNPLIAGWGDTEFRGPSATHLQVLQLPVVSNEYCQQAYSAYKNQKIDEKVLCAGFKMGGKDACQGDSGGPLMQPVWNAEQLKSPIYQIGVVSFGRKCAEAGFPGVYSRVTYFVPWLQEKILGIARR